MPGQGTRSHLLQLRVCLPPLRPCMLQLRPCMANVKKNVEGDQVHGRDQFKVGHIARAEQAGHRDPGCLLLKLVLGNQT